MKCSICDNTDTIIGDCCNRIFCRICWRTHQCSELADRTGHAVVLGTIVQYPNTKRIYQVVDIDQPFRRQGYAYGVAYRPNPRQKQDTERKLILPRLMDVIEPN